MQKNVKRVWNNITTVLVSLMIVLVFLLRGFRLLGYEVLVIQSGSMEPAYHVGSLVYVKPVEPETLEVGDVITFELGGGVRGTHRIIEVLDENSVLSFRTKGDANTMEDKIPVTADSLVGEVKFTIPQLGFFMTYIQKPPGTYVAISVVAVVLLLTILPDLIFPEEKEIRNLEDSK